MANTKIQINCPACMGSGIQQHNTESPVEEECGRCDGEGYIPWGQLDIDLDAKLDAIDTKLDAIDTKLDAIETLIEALEE